MHVILRLIYGDSPAELQIWEKLQRNAEIYRRYLAGEDSVVLGGHLASEIGVSATSSNMNVNATVNSRVPDQIAPV